MIAVEASGPVAEERILAFEDEFHLRLPPEYRHWLRTVGGGRLTRPMQLRNGLIDDFLTLDSPTGYDLAFPRRFRTGMTGNVPLEWLSITSGSGGDVTVKVAGGDEGSIWWADVDDALDLQAHLEEERGAPFLPDETPALPQIMHRLTGTLAEFLETYPVDPQYA